MLPEKNVSESQGTGSHRISFTGAEGEVDLLKEADDTACFPSGGMQYPPHRRRSHSLGKEEDVISESESEMLGEGRKKKDGGELEGRFLTAPEELSDRVRTLAPTLASIPELTLDEASHVRQCFMDLMGERENISNTLELRVLLGNLGFYPPERELELLLQAYRHRVNLSGLIRFLRFYKKDYPVYEGPDRSQYHRLVQSNAAQAGDVFADFSGVPNSLQDEDAIRAFVALGGNEDGSGAVELHRLQLALEEFGVAVDLSEEVLEKDRGLDFVDFCRVWATSGEQGGGGEGVDRYGVLGLLPLSTSALGENDECSFSILNPQTPGPPSLLLSRRISHLPRRLLSMLEVAVSNQTGIAPSAFGGYAPSSRLSLLRATGGGTHGSSLPLTAGGVGQGRSGASSSLALLGRGGQQHNPSLSQDGRGGGGPYSEATAAVVSGNHSYTRDVTVSSDGDGGSQGYRKGGGFSPGGRGETLGGGCRTTEPMSQEEHAQLLCVFLFPERYEGKRTRFTLPIKAGGGASGGKGGKGGGGGGYATNTASSAFTGGGGSGGGGAGGGGNAAAGGGASGAAGPRSGSKPHSPGQGGGGGGGHRHRKGGSHRSRSGRPMLGWKTSSYGKKVDEESDEDDFLSQKNGSAYRPPSPTILSLRHSTAYKRSQRTPQQQKKKEKDSHSSWRRMNDKGGPMDSHCSPLGTRGSGERSSLSS